MLFFLHNNFSKLLGDCFATLAMTVNDVSLRAVPFFVIARRSPPTAKRAVQAIPYNVRDCSIAFAMTIKDVSLRAAL
jgi:hypothetical protein